MHIIDEGSIFDMPLDKLWEFLPSEAHRHPSQKLISREAQGNTVTITSERNINGQMVRGKMKITTFPPLGTAQEYLEGPLAGSKAFAFYTPKGNKTAITVVGDFKLAGVSDEEETRKAIMQMLELSFNEDNAIFKNMK